MSWAEFFAMNGYAWYVWGSYGMCCCFIKVMVRHRRARIFKQILLCVMTVATVIKQAADWFFLFNYSGSFD